MTKAQAIKEKLFKQQSLIGLVIPIDGMVDLRDMPDDVLYVIEDCRFLLEAGFDPKTVVSSDIKDRPCFLVKEGVVQNLELGESQ